MEHTLKNSPISYAVGSSKVTGAEYTFTYDNDCGYLPELEILGLPEFITHNKEDQSFSVQTSKREDESSYVLTINAKVSFSKTYESKSILEVTDSFDFRV
jgi:hypothetical protein